MHFEKLEDIVVATSPALEPPHGRIVCRGTETFCWADNSDSDGEYMVDENWLVRTKMNNENRHLSYLRLNLIHLHHLPLIRFYSFFSVEKLI